MRYNTAMLELEIDAHDKKIQFLTERQQRLRTLCDALTDPDVAQLIIPIDETKEYITPDTMPMIRANANGQAPKNRIAGMIGRPKKKHKGRASMSAPNIINALVKAGKPLTIREIKTATGMADMTICKALGKNSNGFEKTPIPNSNGFAWSLKPNVAAKVANGVVPAGKRPAHLGREANSWKKIAAMLTKKDSPMTIAEIVKGTGLSKSGVKKVLASSGKFAIVGQQGRENIWGLKEVFDIVK